MLKKIQILNLTINLHIKKIVFSFLLDQLENKIPKKKKRTKMSKKNWKIHSRFFFSYFHQTERTKENGNKWKISN